MSAAHGKYRRLWTVPNILCFIRVLIIPLMLYLMTHPRPMYSAVAAVIFALAGLSDIIDGIWARRQKRVTALGSFLDPLADKVLVLSILVTLVGLADTSGAELVAIMVILSHEIAVSALLGIAVTQKVESATPRSNQWKLVVQFFAIIALLLRDALHSERIYHVGVGLLILSAGLSIFSLVEYSFRFARSQNKSTFAKLADS